MMSCMLLVRMGFATSALSAIDLYNRERVHDRRGLTVISQKKWVSYCEQLLNTNLSGSPASPTGLLAIAACEKGFTIDSLEICNAPTGINPPLLRVRIYVLDPETSTKRVVFETTGHERFLVHTHVQGCVQIEFRRVASYTKNKKHFRVWFHTLFAKPDPHTDNVVVVDRSGMDWVTARPKIAHVSSGI